MKRKIVLIITLTLLLTAFVYARFNPFNMTFNMANAAQTFVQMLWNSTMGVNDVAVSMDGNYIAAVNYSGVYYFKSDNSTPKWWFSSPTIHFMSIAISANGEYVVAGDNLGRLYYFNESTTRTYKQQATTWNSTYLGGMIERGTLDISADGEYVAIGGTGDVLNYFAGCRARSGSAETRTWGNNTGFGQIFAVRLSSDGKYVVVGGGRAPFDGFVAFFADANTISPDPWRNATWFAQISTPYPIIDLALSDDGYAVAAIDEWYPLTLHYWANATNLTGDPIANWTTKEIFTSVDMTSDGNSVAAGGPFGSLHFWANAKARQGPQTENWTELENANVYDIAISNDGSIIAASAITRDSYYKAYFFKSDGSMIGEFSLLAVGRMVSMSGDGSIIAVGGGGIIADSLYVFKSTTDSTPPAINNVYQLPANDSVYAEDTVMVYANVTDDYSGVKHVTLNYTTNDGTWLNVSMTNLELDIWNATIPTFEYCTNVTYIIIAEDNANNTAITEYPYKYHVIPEIPTALIAPLFMTITLLSTIVYRRRKKENQNS